MDKYFCLYDAILSPNHYNIETSVMLCPIRNYVASYLVLLEETIRGMHMVHRLFCALQTKIRRKSEDKDFISTTKRDSFSFAHICQYVVLFAPRADL
mmetsp:Transcript_34999/g.73832  ORF Transcript_34999/g.73832 Transcript_34999/m.73832 type:complete len:97 (-) Transcript_34999:600-890(-)